MNNSEIEEIIGDWISYLKREFKVLTNNFHMNDETIEVGSTSQIKFTGTYDFDTKPKSYVVDSLAHIGWPDPFPKPIALGKAIEPKLSRIQKLRITTIL